MNLETVKRYFHEEDKYCGFTGDHPLKHHFKECGGLAYVRRTDKDIVEIIFRCNSFGGAHIVRECKENCPNFAMCGQISAVLAKEAIMETLYPMISE